MSRSKHQGIKPAIVGEFERSLEAIVIGASAGGIQALRTILATLPAQLRLPIIVVLHIPESRESLLADVFSYHLAPPVFFAQDKEQIRPDVIYFAGPAYHLSIEEDRSFSLSQEEPLHFSRPSIDILMMSAADAYGSALMGILLTGANADGAEGLATIKFAGGITVVQDPDEAEFPLMPLCALEAHQPNFILTLAEIRALIERVEII